MFNFDFQKTAIYQAVKWEEGPSFKGVGFFKKLSFTLFLFCFLLFLYGFLPANFSLFVNQRLLGASLLFLSLGIVYWTREAFLNFKIKQPKLLVDIPEAVKSPEEYNLAGFLNFKVAKAVNRAIQFSKKKRLPNVNSSVLFYSLLEDSPELEFVFSRALLNLKEIKKIIQSHSKLSKKKRGKGKKSIDYSKDFQETIIKALKIAKKRGGERICTGDILSSLALHDLVFKKILIDAQLKAEDIENLVWWLETLEKRETERRQWWEYRNLIKRGVLAKEWTAGYTITLDQFSRDWTETIKRADFPQTIGHKEELEQLERILSGEETNNVLLVGEPGTGRKSIVQAFTVNSALGQSLPKINYKTVKELNLPAVLAQLQGREETEAFLNRIFEEVLLAGNVVLVIDNLHSFVGVKEGLGVVDISGLLSSYLKYPQFRLIAITDFAGLQKNIEQNLSFLALLKKVEVSEISERETLMLLEKLAQALEFKYKKFISYPALRNIIEHSKRYFPHLPFPEKAIDLLEEVMVYVFSKKDNTVLSSHVDELISEKTQIPVGEIKVKEREILLNLEKLIHKRIINQDEAVDEVSSALRRARAEVTIRKGPIGGFLFLGPTGVGKTETTKALTEIYFGAESKMIRLDMSEFQAVEDIPRLIGSPGEEGLLTTKVRENPFSLILLDEIEKAHSNILNLFLQVLDEGHLTDGLGRRVDFKNAIIVATSNAGYKIILKALKEKEKWENVKQKLLDYLFEKAIFRPEFINRFDGVIVFRPLSHENLLDIAEIMLQKLKKNLVKKDIEFIITKELKEKMVELGYNPIFGAREMRRVIQDTVENVLAEAILSGRLKRGKRVKVEPKNFELVIK
jgi:ATP-dependent Clp protease ATP-binding subunit ClpC